MADPRLARCMDRAANALPWLEPEHLDAVVRAVLGAADQMEQEAWVEDNGMPADLPDWTYATVNSLLPGQAYWDVKQGAWAIVAASPFDDEDDDLIIICEGGNMVRLPSGVGVSVANDLGQAIGWNKRHAAVRLVEDIDVAGDWPPEAAA